jgi:hypothetical protein
MNKIHGAFRDMTAISRGELDQLIKEGIRAALAKRYGRNVQAEIEIDAKGCAIKITVLREVVAEVKDPSCQVSLEEARWDDSAFEVGDVMEVPVEVGQLVRSSVSWRPRTAPDPVTDNLEALFDRMQTPEVRAATRRAFNASPDELRQAAMEAARRSDG